MEKEGRSTTIQYMTSSLCSLFEHWREECSSIKHE